jgi:hypothetical protein
LTVLFDYSGVGVEDTARNFHNTVNLVRDLVRLQQCT